MKIFENSKQKHNMKFILIELGHFTCTCCVSHMCTQTSIDGIWNFIYQDQEILDSEMKIHKLSLIKSKEDIEHQQVSLLAAWISLEAREGLLSYMPVSWEEKMIAQGCEWSMGKATPPYRDCHTAKCQSQRAQGKPIFIDLCAQDTQTLLTSTVKLICIYMHCLYFINCL